MQAMMEEAKRNHEALPFDPEAEQLSDRDLERLAEEARKALRKAAWTRRGRRWPNWSGSSTG